MSQNIWGGAQASILFSKLPSDFTGQARSKTMGGGSRFGPISFSGSDQRQRGEKGIKRDSYAFLFMFPFVYVWHSGLPHMGMHWYLSHPRHSLAVEPLPRGYLYEEQVAKEGLCKYAALALDGLGSPSPVPDSTSTLLGSAFTKESKTVIHLGWKR